MAAKKKPKMVHPLNHKRSALSDIMTKSVFFDWDGTLVDSLGMLADAHNHVRATLGYPLWSKQEYHAAMTRSTRELYPMLYGDDIALHAQGILYDFIKEKHLSYLKLMPDAKELLDELAALNVSMAVVSNKRNDVLVAEVEALGWQNYFGVYMGAGVAIKDKPSSAPIFHAIAAHPAKPLLTGLIYVGDTETDLKTCAETKCDCAFVQHDGRRDDLVATYKPVIAVDTLAQLREKLLVYVRS